MRRGAWLIWLCLALLPLRGMAHATMLAAGAPHGGAAAMVQVDAGAPCPMHAANANAGADASGHVSAQVPHAGGCQLCTLCHSAALPMALPACTDGAVPDAAPATLSSLGAGRLAPDGLFRPPR